MNYRQLGNTGIQVSELGMGCWGIGSTAYGNTDDNTSREAILTAYDNGINFFDTADVYGAGHSEEILGDVLKPVRDKVVIATKVGSIPHVGREMPHILHPQHIRIACEASLMRLKTDYIDLYQLHSPPLETNEDLYTILCALEELSKLKLNGKIRAIGISFKSPYAIECVTSEVDVFQVNFNMLDQRLLDSDINTYNSWGIGFIARTPLAFGFLSGRYTSTPTFQQPHHLSYWPQEQINLWANATNLFQHLKPAHLTWSQFALSFILSHSEISTTIPGMLTPDEVRENIVVEKLSDDVMAEIRRIYLENEFFISG